MDKKFVKETVVAVMIALVVAIAKLTFQSMGIYDFLFLGGVALYAFLGVFLIRQARLLEKAREQWLGEKRQKLISNRVWEHFKGKFECPDADFQGKILARYDLAPDKQAKHQAITKSTPNAFREQRSITRGFRLA